MKKTITILITVLVLIILNSSLIIDNCEAQWQNDVRLTYSPDTSRLGYHNGNMASNGNYVHVFWYDKRDGNFEIYYKRSTDGGTNWSSDIRLTNNAGNSQMPSCALNGSTVNVAWNDNTSGTYQVYYKRSTDSGITWSTDTLLTNVTPPAAGYFYPHMALSGLLMFIVWYENRDGNNEIYYKRSTNGGISWEADTRLTNDPALSTLPSVAVSEQNVHIVWKDQRDGNAEVYYKLSTNGGVSWNTDTRLTNDPAASEIPYITASGSNIHIVWYDNRDGNNEVYYKLSANGGLVWGIDARVTNDPASSSMPCLSISGSNVHIVWHDNRDGNNEVYYKLSTNAGISWGTDTRLTNDPASSERPGISISISLLHVLWFDTRDGNQEIYYKRNPAGNVGIQNISLEIPKEYILMQNYPNPFNPSTIINFQLPANNFTTITIYDIAGRVVETLVNKHLKAGTYQAEWNGSIFFSGVYFYRLTAGDFTDVKRMILVK